MHVRVFIFRQAHGKGSARREQHRDGLAGEGFWRFGAWSAFHVGSNKAGSAHVHAWGIADPASRVSCTVGGAPAHDLCVCVVSALSVRQVCMPFNFGGCLGRMDLQDFRWADTEEQCSWTHNSTPSYPSKFCVVQMTWA